MTRIVENDDDGHLWSSPGPVTSRWLINTSLNYICWPYIGYTTTVHWPTTASWVIPFVIDLWRDPTRSQIMDAGCELMRIGTGRIEPPVNLTAPPRASCLVNFRHPCS